jgi:hypothetical protein
MSLGTRGTGVVLDAQEQKMHYFYVDGVIPILHIPTDDEKAFSGTGEMLQQKIKKSYSEVREQNVADEIIEQINPAVVNEVGTQQFLEKLKASNSITHPMTIRSADYAVVQKRKNTADDIIKTIVEEGSYYVKYLCTHSDYLLQAPAQFISKGDDQYGFYRFNIGCSLNHGVVQDRTDFSNEIQTIHKELRKKSGTSPLMFLDAENHVFSVGFSGLTDALKSTVPLLLDIVYVVVTRRSSKSRKILEVFVKFVENLDSEFSDIFTRLFDISENYRFRLGSVGLGFWTLSFTSRDGKEHYATQIYLANKFPRYFLYIDTPDVNKIWKKNEFRYDSMVKKVRARLSKYLSSQPNISAEKIRQKLKNTEFALCEGQRDCDCKFPLPDWISGMFTQGSSIIFNQDLLLQKVVFYLLGGEIGGDGDSSSSSGSESDSSSSSGSDSGKKKKRSRKPGLADEYGFPLDVDVAAVVFQLVISECLAQNRAELCKWKRDDIDAPSPWSAIVYHIATMNSVRMEESNRIGLRVALNMFDWAAFSFVGGYIMAQNDPKMGRIWRDMRAKLLRMGYDNNDSRDHDNFVKLCQRETSQPEQMIQYMVKAAGNVIPGALHSVASVGADPSYFDDTIGAKQWGMPTIGQGGLRLNSAVIDDADAQIPVGVRDIPTISGAGDPYAKNLILRALKGGRGDDADEMERQRNNIFRTNHFNRLRRVDDDDDDGQGQGGQGQGDQGQGYQAQGQN